MIGAFDKSFDYKSGIYIIRSLVDTRTYIGSAARFKTRFFNHKGTLQKGTHCNAKLQNFYNKYGKKSLEFSVLEICQKEFLIKREQYYIDLYKPEFNIAPKAGNTLGRICKEETKTKISQSNKGKIKNHSKDWANSVTKMLKLRNTSPEMKKKISDAKSIPVAQYDLDGIFMRSYKSSKEAAIDNGLHRSSVHACCKGTRPNKNQRKMLRSGNYQWKFYFDDNSNIEPYIKPKILGRPKGIKSLALPETTE